MMFSDMVTNKKMAIGILVVQAMLLFAIFLTGNLLFAILAIVSFVIASVIWRFGYMIQPILTRKAAITETFGNYEIPPERDLIVQKAGGKYLASSFVSLDFSQSSTEKNAEQLALMRRSYERAISSVNYTYKLSCMICPVDLSMHTNKIKEKRSNAESRLSELASLPSSANQAAEMSKLRREIEFFDTQLEKIQSGEKPMKAVNYAMTTAESGSKEEAMMRARQQALELKSLLASNLDSTINVLRGSQLKRCFEWERQLPDKEMFDDFRY
jgi:hypothetical protein